MEIEASPSALSPSAEDETVGSYLPMALYPLRHSGGGAPRPPTLTRRRRTSSCDPSRTFSLRRPRTSSLCGSPSDQRKRGGYKQPRIDSEEPVKVGSEASAASFPRKVKGWGGRLSYRWGHALSSPAKSLLSKFQSSKRKNRNSYSNFVVPSTVKMPAKLLLALQRGLQDKRTAGRVCSASPYVSIHPRSTEVRDPLTISVVGAEMANGFGEATLYVVKVVDIRTGTRWTVKRKFKDFYRLRRELKVLYKRSGGSRSDPNGQFRLLLSLPFPHRFSSPSSLSSLSSQRAVRQRIRQLNLFLKYLACWDLVHQNYVNARKMMERMIAPSEKFLVKLRATEEANVGTKRYEESPERDLELWLFRILNNPFSREGRACIAFSTAFLQHCASIGELGEEIEEGEDEEDDDGEGDLSSMVASSISSSCSTMMMTEGRMSSSSFSASFYSYSKTIIAAGDEEGKRERVMELFSQLRREDLPLEVRKVMTQVTEHILSALEKPFYTEQHALGEGEQSPPSLSPLQWEAEKRKKGTQSNQCYELLRDSAMVAVEEALFFPLQPVLLSLLRSSFCPKEAEELRHSMECLRRADQDYFGISRLYQSREQRGEEWADAVRLLKCMDQEALPSQKLKYLLLSAQAIFREVRLSQWRQKRKEEAERKAAEKKEAEESGDEAMRQTSKPDSQNGGDSSPTEAFPPLTSSYADLSADDFLPIHIFVVSRANLRDPLGTKAMLNLMIHPEKERGEIGYFLTLFAVALQYITEHKREIEERWGEEEKSARRRTLLAMSGIGTLPGGDDCILGGGRIAEEGANYSFLTSLAADADSFCKGTIFFL